MTLPSQKISRRNRFSLNFLTKRGYRAEKIQPVDMFPHTDHVECVVRLDKMN